MSTATIHSKPKNYGARAWSAGQHLHTPKLGGYMATFGVLLLFVVLGLAVAVLPKRPELVVLLAAGVTGALSIVRWPVLGTYISAALAILFDVFPNEFVSTPISEMGIFRNLSTRGLPQAVFLNLFELIVLLTLASVLVRHFHDRKKLARGPLYGSTLVFGVIVLMGRLTGYCWVAISRSRYMRLDRCSISCCFTSSR